MYWMSLTHTLVHSIISVFDISATVIYERETPMTHLYFIRHAQADGLQPDIVGSKLPDSGLSGLGRKQAERLRDRLVSTGEIKPDVLISSTLRRARETAEILAPAFALPVIDDDEVQELNLGDVEGLTVAEVEERFGVFSHDREPFRRLGSTGESWGQFTFRACHALDRLAQCHVGKTIIVVTHGRVIECSFLYFLGMNAFKQLPIVLDIKNTSITHWHLDHFPGYGHDGPQWCLHTYNDYAHLKEISQ